MQKVIIFGIGDFACQMFRYLSYQKDIRVVAFAVQNDYLTQTEYLGLPVISLESMEGVFPANSHKILVCVGYTKMNSIREKVYFEIKKCGYEIMSYIHETATILSKDIGYGCIILENVTIGIGCKVGVGDIFFPNTTISHDTEIGNYNFFAPSVAVAGHVKIKNYCFLGIHSTVRDNVRIDDYTLLGAATYLKHDSHQFDVFKTNNMLKAEVKSTEVKI